MTTSINSKVKYHSFGFIPSGNFRSDLFGKLFGFPNLLKRLQANDIMRALAIQPQDIVLDFGCGAGFFTVEMAKLAQKAYGIDIIPYILQIKIPPTLADRLEYIQAPGTSLPFEDHHFDRVLAGEILPMIPDPNEFIQEIKRVLKPGGRLVVSNGAGHPVIREAYIKRPFWFRFLEKRYPQRMPKSYEEYCAVLQKSFGTSRSDFLSESDIRGLLDANGFEVDRVDYTPGFLAGAYISLSQLLMFLRTGRTISQHNFAWNYIFWSFVRWFEPYKHKGGLLCTAHSLTQQAERSVTKHTTQTSQPTPAMYAPYSIQVYRQVLSQAAHIPNLQAVSFAETSVPSSLTQQLFVRHDVDTAECVRKLPLLMDVDREFGISAGIYFRVDDQEYLFSSCRDLILSAKKSGFHVGLHSTCYLHDDYMSAFQQETEKFAREVGFAPESFNVHGLGEYRLDVRLKFYAEVPSRFREFGYKFSDCCAALRAYDHVVQDCYWDEVSRRRYLQNDFLNPQNSLRQGTRFLILTHPVYWQDSSQ
jgi:ubiquinone/menaquinone biosynthesis C-methylase UbiE